MAIQRSLARVPLSLNEAREGRLPVLPPLPREAHGYSVTSLPEDRQAAMVYASGDMLPFVRQRYTRYFAELTGSFDDWFAGLSRQYPPAAPPQGQEDRARERRRPRRAPFPHAR
ncbi:MAG: hypothetical protein WDN44_13870 [Sphingomonas sp.]